MIFSESRFTLFPDHALAFSSEACPGLDPGVGTGSRKQTASKQKLKAFHAADFRLC
jgi:hypothetical protein